LGEEYKSFSSSLCNLQSINIDDNYIEQMCVMWSIPSPWRSLFRVLVWPMNITLF
jgi:hypothetical protein